MAKKKEKHPGGRPRFEFTEEQLKQIDQMALDNCNTNTIATAIGCTFETLELQFKEQIIQKRAEGRAALRRSQRAMSDKNPAMAIFLGKNELEQADKHEVGHSVSEETVKLLGLIDGSSKGTLPNPGEAEEAGQ